MTQQLTPPPELVQQWRNEGYGLPGTLSEYVAARAVQWGADQELEACCEWVSQWTPRWPDGTRTEDKLRAARRLRPPSLKRVALLQLDTLNADLGLEGKSVDLSQIRRALEQLDD